MKSIIALIVVVVASVQLATARNQCGCYSPRANTIVTRIDAEGLRERAGHIMTDVYDSASTLLTLLGFPVQQAGQDRYNVNPEVPCFTASLKAARLTNNGQYTLADVTISGTAYEDRLETSICSCRSRGKPSTLCEVDLPQAIMQRHEEVKNMAG